jgi:N-acetylmuramoyl-L-alanine amidase
MIRRGSTGAAVAEVRARLAHLGFIDYPTSVVEAANFDEDLDRAVRTFQQERGLSVDGIVGPDTYRRLDQARWKLGDRVLAYLPGHLMAGDDVADLQRRLAELGFDSGRPDGIFGPRTDGALREFQLSVGEQPDGTCGPATFRAFDRLVRTISGGNAADLRDRLTLAALRTGIADKVIVLDAGSGAGADIGWSIAQRVEGRLAALGTQVLMTGRTVPETDPDDEPDRAGFANRTGADLFICIDCDQVSSAKPNGLATFYYGDPVRDIHSLSGRMLAEILQEELCAQTGLCDLRAHARSWDLLRLTRMPAVKVVVGYLSNPQDAARLGDDAVQDRLAHGIARSLRRFCRPG